MTWRTMDTADEESTDTILVSTPAYRFDDGTIRQPNVVPARFCGYRSRNGKMDLYDLTDCDRDGDYSDVWPAPTHWMPLPNPVPSVIIDAIPDDPPENNRLTPPE